MKLRDSSRDGSGLLPIDAGALTLCVVVTGLLYVAAFRPLMVQRADAADAMDVLAEEQSSAALLDGQCRRIVHHLNQFEKRRPGSAMKLEDPSQLNARLDELIQLAQRCGLTINAVHPGMVTAGRYFDVVALQLMTESTYGDAVTFLRTLHTTYEDISVGAFELQVAGNASPRANATFDLAWYVVKRGNEK